MREASLLLCIIAAIWGREGPDWLDGTNPSDVIPQNGHTKTFKEGGFQGRDTVRCERISFPRCCPWGCDMHACVFSLLLGCKCSIHLYV